MSTANQPACTESQLNTKMYMVKNEETKKSYAFYSLTSIAV